MAVVSIVGTARAQKSAKNAPKVVNLVKKARIRKFLIKLRKFAFLGAKNERNVEFRFYAKCLFGRNFS